MKTKEELRLYFENGDIPKQEDFWEWQNSYWHKDEKIEMRKISGLENGTFNLLYAKMDANKNASIDFFAKRKLIIEPGTLNIPAQFTYGITITELEIPDSVTSIGEGAFSTSNLTVLNLPNTLTDIEERAFAGNKLTSLYLPDSVINLGNVAFIGNQLTEVRLPKNLKIISSGLFSSNKIQSIEIPDGVTEIKSEAFTNNQLTSVIIPDSVLNIEMNAFRDNLLTKVTLGPNTSYSPYSFDSTVEIVGGKLIN